MHHSGQRAPSGAGTYRQVLDPMDLRANVGKQAAATGLYRDPNIYANLGTMPGESLPRRKFSFLGRGRSLSRKLKHQPMWLWILMALIFALLIAFILLSALLPLLVRRQPAVQSHSDPVSKPPPAPSAEVDVIDSAATTEQPDNRKQTEDFTHDWDWVKAKPTTESDEPNADKEAESTLDADREAESTPDAAKEAESTPDAPETDHPSYRLSTALIKLSTQKEPGRHDVGSTVAPATDCFASSQPVVDLHLLIDNTAAITDKGIQAMKTYVTGWLLPSLHVSAAGTHVSLATYNRWVMPVLPLTHNRQLLTASVNNVKVTRERQLNLGRALSEAQLFSTGRRDNASTVILAFTANGRSSDDALVPAMALRAEGASVVLVSLSDNALYAPDNTYLNRVASSPNLHLRLSRMADASTLTQQLIDAVCTHLRHTP